MAAVPPIPIATERQRKSNIATPDPYRLGVRYRTLPFTAFGTGNIFCHAGKVHCDAKARCGRQIYFAIGTGYRINLTAYLFFT